MAPELGIVEGFFGRPWTWDQRADAAAFLARSGYDFYLYAPKADAYLRRCWRDFHPDDEAKALAVFAKTCRAEGLRFGIGLSPFELHLHEEGDWQRALVAKVKALNAFGPDDLAILFDDMRGDVADLAERQAQIVAVAADATNASRILCCPSYYSDDPILDVAFGQRPPRYLQDLGQLLDPSVELFWTGPEVVSLEYTAGHLDRVADEMGRKPFLWDNYPVNDGPRMARHLHLRGFTGRGAAIGPHIAGHAVNPASQPLLSRIPLLTLVQSYAQGDGYDYAAAFQEAAEQLLGAELGRRVTLDLLSLHDRGLDRLGERRSALRARYAAFDHPAAAEIVAWLDGAWDVTDELVQTQ